MEDDYKCICGLGEEHTADCATYNSGREAGMKKVVEDFETVLDAPESYRWAMFFDVLNGWQEQLKEKGL